MEELRQLLEDALHEWQRDFTTDANAWSAIEGEPATFSNGDMFFISVVNA